MEHISHFLFWKTVNTVILIAILYYLLKKPVSKFFSNGIGAVISKFERAKQEKEETLKLLREAEKKSQEAKIEAENIIREAQELAKSQSKAMLSEAQAVAERVVKMADEEIEQETYKAKEELRRFAAMKALELAEKKLKTAVDHEANKKLIESSLQKL